MSTKALPPLGSVMNWIEDSGFKVSYAYEDLVFIESNAFLIRFDAEKPENIHIHFNMDCDPDKAVALGAELTTQAVKHRLKTAIGNKFSLAQKNEKEVDITFEVK